MKNQQNIVGIISINMYSMHMNYGAALHSWALQQYLKKIGVNSIIIDYMPRFMSDWSLTFPLASYLSRLFRKTIVYNDSIGFKKISKILFSTAYWAISSLFGISYLKYKKFSKFFRNNYYKTNMCYTEKTIITLPEDIQTIICESDVIWSPVTTKGFDPGYFCDFPTFKTRKIVSYAASIGDYNFTDSEKCEFRRLLTNFDNISVRENGAVEFIKQFTNSEITAVLDPTLLLDASDYEKILIQTKEERYLLIYHCMELNVEMVRTAKKIAKEKGLKLVEVSMFIKDGTHKVYSTAGIGEFLGLYRDASFVVTNGFHGICFAIIFKKDFISFARQSKNSRLINILNILGLDERMSNAKNYLVFNTSINYDDIYAKLNNERKKSAEYINKILMNIQ